MHKYGSSAYELSPETIEEVFSDGVEAAFPLSAETDARLEIEPRIEEMRLILPATSAKPDISTYERISVDRINVIGLHGDWYRLTIDAESMHYEAYTLLVSIVDQIEKGAPFSRAVERALTGLKDLLRSRKILSAEKEAGLIGELLVLRYLLDEVGEEGALASWRGPDAEEHDFGLASCDVEVKTTRSERRHHRISSESQLEPTPGRPLYLVSLQITLAGIGDEAFTLPELITDVRRRIDGGRLVLDDALRSLGWRDASADLYRSRFVLRTVPRAYRVDPGFPAVTGEHLDRVVPQRRLVSGVSYRVDVSDLSYETPPEPLAHFCEEPT